MQNNNEVIIIGGNHFNTLSVIRCIGRKKINFKLLIHEDNKDLDEMMIFHSKYCKNVSLVNNNEKDIVNYLLNNKNNNDKQIIIPCSDLAEYSIDNNYKKLEKYYFIPGFKDKPGEVVKLMDKYAQKRWAQKNNIPMAKSWYIDLKENKKLPKDIVYPCIIKPLVSAFGKKGDIKICNNKEELDKSVKYYIEHKYINLLIQEFLKKEYELCAVGCIFNNGKYYGKIIKKIREYPITGGSTSFARFIDDFEIAKKVGFIINGLIKDGYAGLYDIEIINCNDQFYLNEINFRNSGNSYALIKSGIEAPYLLYLEKSNPKLLEKKVINSRNFYFMEDISNLNSIKNKEISIIQFCKDFLKTRAHSIFDLKDLKVFNFYIKKLLKRR